MTREIAAIVLAAGKSTRMNSATPKVLHQVCGRPLLAYVLDACFDAGIRRICVVVGYQRQQVMDAFAHDKRLVWVHQHEQLGSGHAVKVCAPEFENYRGDVVIIAGDMPLIKAHTLRELIATHRRAGAAVTIGTTQLEDPTGYGRIMRDPDGHLAGIVEHRDCSSEQLQIKEVNPSYYAFDAQNLFDTLQHVTADNDKGEYYLTDAVHLIIRAGKPSATLTGIDPTDALGVNSPDDLALVEQTMKTGEHSVRTA